MSGGGGGGSQYSVTQNYSPEEAARRAQVMDEAKRVYDANKGKVIEGAYPGSEPVGPSDATRTAWDMLYRSVPSMQRLAGGAEGAVMRGTGEEMLYADSNPYLQSYINAAVRPIKEQFLDAGGTLSGVRTEAQNAGGFGTNTRQGIAEGLATARANQAIADTAAKISSEGYGQGLEHQARMAALAPGAQTMATVPGQVVGAVGTQQEGFSQELEDYLASSRLWDMEKEWGPLQNYANIVYGAGSSQSTAMSQAPQARSNKALGALGGGLAGYQLATSIGMANPLVGAGVGALIGLFG